MVWGSPKNSVKAHENAKLKKRAEEAQEKQMGLGHPSGKQMGHRSLLVM